MAIVIGGRTVQADDGRGYQPQGITTIASNQGGGPAGMTFGEAASVKKPSRFKFFTEPAIMSEQEAQQAQAIIDKNQPATAGGLTAQQLRDRRNQPKTGIVQAGQDLLAKVSPLANFIQGTQSTDNLFKKLVGGLELGSTDKVTLVNLVDRLGSDPKNIENLIKKYADQNKLSSSEALDLAGRFNQEYSDIGSTIFSSGITDYFDRMDNMGLGETIKTMAGDLTGTRDTEGIVTLENVTDRLGTEGLQFLKVTNPQAYYRLRPNDPDLANESFVSTGDPVADRRFNAKIMEARALAADKQSRQDANMGQGIMAASPALPGLPVTTPVIPPVTPPTAPPTTTPVATGITPFDIRQFYATLPQYTQQGIMNPNLAQFYQNLGMFPGMTT